MSNVIEFSRLCPACFAEKGRAGTCPHCGYDESLKRGPLVLAHRTLLHNGQYLIGKVLGKPGGFGITYLALDTRLETRVAIKEYLPRDLAGRDSGQATISAHSSEDGEFFRYGLTQFLQEARTLARFDHANIVRVRNFFEENGTGYLVMDYYDGVTLADHLSQQPQGKLPEKTAVGILMPILDGLREVHAKNFLHRDIKPQNIYLTTGNRPILLDFGAARQAMSERSRSLSVVLSEGYAPYEQYHRRGEQGPWTDIYASAAVLYHAVAGEPPPPATERVHKDELEFNALGVSKSLGIALRSGLAVDHKNRPQTMAEFQALLLGRIDAEATENQGRKPGLGEKTVPLEPLPKLAQFNGQPTRKWVWSLLAGVIVVFIAATVMWINGGKQSAPTVLTPPPVAIEAEKKTAPTVAAPVPAASETTTRSPDARTTEAVPQPASGVQRPSPENSEVAAEQARKEAQRKADIAATERLKADRQASAELVAKPIALWTNALSLMAEEKTTQANALIQDALELLRKMDATSVDLIRRMAERGSPAEQTILGAMYKNGLGVIENKAESAKWQLKAANQGYWFAQLIIGLKYINGDGVIKDEAEGVRWIRKAADQGNVTAQLFVGVLYAEGQSGVSTDLSEAVRWFRKAAEQGNVFAQALIGGVYLKGGNGVSKDTAEGIRWARKAADEGNARAQYFIGLAYLYGENVAKDEAAAITWFRKAAEQGHTEAKAKLKELGK